MAASRKPDLGENQRHMFITCLNFFISWMAWFFLPIHSDKFFSRYKEIDGQVGAILHGHQEGWFPLGGLPLLQIAWGVNHQWITDLYRKDAEFAELLIGFLRALLLFAVKIVVFWHKWGYPLLTLFSMKIYGIFLSYTPLAAV